MIALTGGQGSYGRGCRRTLSALDLGVWSREKLCRRSFFFRGMPLGNDARHVRMAACRDERANRIMSRRIIISDYTYERLKKLNGSGPEERSLIARDHIGEAFFGRHGDQATTEKVRNRLFWMAGRIQGEKVLDVGASEGILSILAGREGFKVLGIDLNPDALAYAEKLLASEPDEVRSRVTFRVCDLASFAAKGEKFDTVIAGEVIEHLISPRRFLETCSEVLEDNGVLILTTPFGISSDEDHKQTFFPGDLAALAKGLFAVEEIGVTDGYIRLVARKDAQASGADYADLLAVTEDGAYAAQAAAQQLLDLRRQALKTAAAEIEGLKGKIESLKGEAEGLKGALASAEARNKELSAENERLQARLCESARDNGQIKAQLQSLQARIGALRGAALEGDSPAAQRFSLTPSGPAGLAPRPVKLTKRGATFRLPVKGGANYQFRIEFAGRIPEDRREALARFQYYDGEGKPIAPPYPKTHHSEKVGAYLYLHPKNFRDGACLLSVVAPSGAAFLEMAIAAWQPFKRRPLRMNPSVGVTLEDPAMLGRNQAIKALIEAASATAGAPVTTASVSGGRPATSPPLLTHAKSSAAAPQKLRALSILDEISELNWSGEFDLVRLDRQAFSRQIAEADYDFALLESCWKGNGGDWEYAFTSPGLKHANAQALLTAIDQLRERSVKIVFWNKEDPMHYDRFLPIAERADIVFTTDSNKIAAYERDTGKPASALPFAASPRICNPAGRFKTAPETVCFAGAYYSEGHDERNRQMEFILPAIEKYSGAIYDRYSTLNNERYAFPSRYRPFIRESVPFSKIVDLYKSFKVFLNVNTIIDSPTMMSRRVYEILATGTPVVSAPSAALEEQLPGLVEIAATEREALDKVGRLLDDEDYWERRSHQGYREVQTRHTYRRRARAMSDFARLGAPRSEEPLVSIVVASCRPANVDRIIENVTRQNYPRLEVIYAVTPNFSEADRNRLVSVSERSPFIGRTKLLAFGEEVALGRCLNEAVKASQGEFIAKFDDDNFYFDDFIADLMIPFQFGDYAVVGKESYYCYLGGSDKLIWRFPESRHRETKFVAGDAMIMRREIFNEISFPEKRVGEDTKLLQDITAIGGKIYSADHFNFIKYRDADLANHTWREAEEVLMRKSVVVASGLDRKIPAC